MNRIKTMLMALMAVLAVGAVGASVASAAGTGKVTLPGTGGCDIQFTNSAWSGGSGSWSSETESVSTLPGGDCDVDSVTGAAEITKYAIDPDTGKGAATLDGQFTFRVIGGLVTCTYSASLAGAGSFWHWTNHWTPPGADPDIGHNDTNINNPGNPATDDKMFHFTGTATKDSGPGLFCPSSAAVQIDLRDHNTH